MINMSSYHPGGANVAFADGSVRFIKSSTAMNVIWSLGSKAGGGGCLRPTRIERTADVHLGEWNHRGEN